MSRRGLPETLKMRHDSHYVDALAASAGSPIGRIVPIDAVDPNPNQPRQVMGDLSELMASIAEKGIIEPIIVRQRGARFQIVAGERRYQAAVQVGITEMPVIIREVDDSEILEIALIENLQRKDLTVFEEAEALHALAAQAGYTHEDLALHLGKSRSSITESLTLNGMPDEVKDLCRLADITSKSLLLHVLRQKDKQAMIDRVERITSGEGATRHDVRRLTKSSGSKRPKPFVYSYRPPNKVFSLRLSFRKSKVERVEIIDALERLLDELRRT